jgi:hypothetical protein
VTAYDDALDVLAAAIQTFEAATRPDLLASGWVLVTQAVLADGADASTVLNYGGPAGQSWTVTAGLLRWATLTHDQALDP